MKLISLNFLTTKNIYVYIRYYVKSGNPEHPDDKLYNASFHIKTVNPIEPHRLPKSYIPTSDKFYIIDKFSNELGTVRGTIDPAVTGKIAQIRIHIPNSSETWIIISEIDFSAIEELPVNQQQFFSSIKVSPPAK